MKRITTLITVFDDGTAATVDDPIEVNDLLNELLRRRVERELQRRASVRAAESLPAKKAAGREKKRS